MADIDLVVSAARSAGDLAGVFEYDGEVAYFYRYSMETPERPRITGALKVFSGSRQLSESEIRVAWTQDEGCVGLYIQDVLYAVFSVDQGFCGAYETRTPVELPPEVRCSFASE
jgi:hypothetical protein